MLIFILSFQSDNLDKSTIASPEKKLEEGQSENEEEIVELNSTQGNEQLDLTKYRIRPKNMDFRTLMYARHKTYKKKDNALEESSLPTICFEQ